MDDGWSDDDLQESIRRLQGNAAETAEMTSCKTAAPVATTADRSCQLQAMASVWDSALKEFHNGLPMRLLRKHARGCQVRLKGGCDVCSLARRGPRWMAKSKVDRAVFPHSWLEASLAPGATPIWGIGCRICRLTYNSNGENDNGGSWAQLGVRGTCVQKSAIVTHAKSRRHRRARSAFLLAIAGSDANAVQQAALAAPSLEDFRVLLCRLRESHGRLSRKQSTMVWCLFEALRDSEREFLKTASCMSLAQDARAGRLLTRWVACGNSDRELVVRSGVLQLHRGQAAGAMALQLTTRKGLRGFATSRRTGGAIFPVRVPPKLDRQLWAHMAAITEVFVADGASDEQLAGELLRPMASGLGGDANHVDHPLVRPLPNLKLVLMDRAHASRRVLQRTWDKDEYLNSILKALIWDKSSLVRVLQNSDVAKDLFHDLQLHEDDSQHPVSNMGFAKQRFDSCAKPLSRLIDHFDAATSAAAELVRRRPPKDALSMGATRALRVLNDEAVLQLGMLADCAEVTLQFTRFLDTESYDKARLPAKLREFCHQCDYLFMKGGCFTWPGRTQFVVRDLLSRRRLIFPRPQEPLTIGDAVNPVPDEVRQRCLARMINWWQLARGVLEADFPQYDLLHSFAVFDLDLAVDGANVVVASRLTTQDCHALETWADRLHLDIVALKEQFLLLRGVAAGFRKNSSDTLDAWQKAVFETQRIDRRRVHYPISALLPLLRRFAAYTASTCGVEQAFSKFKRVLGESRGFSPHAEERVCVLSSISNTPDDDIALASRARLIWATHFGTPRETPRLQCIPHCRPKRFAQTGEAAGKRARQASLTALVAGSCNGNIAMANSAIQKAGTLWGQRQATELAKRQALSKKRRIDAILHGTCTPGEEDDLSAVAKYGQQLRQKRLHIAQKFTTVNVISRAPRHNLPAGTRVFVEPVLAGNNGPIIQESISKLRWRQVSDRVLAQVLVVSDPARPDPKDAFVAALGGRLLVSYDFLVNAGRGVVIQYDRALRLPRYLWVSPSCEVAFASALEVMRRMCQHAGTGDEPRSRWKFDTSDEFLGRRGRGKSGQYELVALVVPHELKDRALRQYPGRTTLMTFIKRCTKINTQMCQAGVLGR